MVEYFKKNFLHFKCIIKQLKRRIAWVISNIKNSPPGTKFFKDNAINRKNISIKEICILLK